MVFGMSKTEVDTVAIKSRLTRGQLYVCNPMYKCLGIWPTTPKIQPGIPAISKIPVIREMRPKISEIQLENLEIRRKSPKILEIRREIFRMAWNATCPTWNP